MTNLLLNFSSISLGISTLCYGFFFFVKKKEKTFLSGLGQKTLLLSFIILFGSLLFRWINYSYFPLSNLYESLIFLSCLLSGLSIWIEKKSKMGAALINPIILMLTLFATFVLPESLQKASPLVPSLQSDWLMFHVSAMILSYASLIFGSLLSVFLLALKLLEKKEKEEKNDSKKLIYENLDKFSYQIITLGFPILTLGIIAGAVWANEAWGSYWSWDPKETWSLITWLIFATYLHARIIKKWEKEKAAIIAAIGFFSIWICYLGVNFLAKGLHSYGWVA